MTKTEMDDLCIKMIANTKKLHTKPKEESLNNNIERVIQILSKLLMKYDAVQKHPHEFAKFLEVRLPHIVASFEKSLSGKIE